MFVNKNNILIVVLCGIIFATTVLAQDFRPPSRGLQINQPQKLKKKYNAGMAHGEALFGVPEYGSKRGPLRLIDAMRGNESTGCDKWTLPPNLKIKGAFFVLVNRGKCHFTEKVLHAQSQGAKGVIVKDNQFLIGQPVSYCPGPFYEEPQRLVGKKWVPCVAETVGDCYCYATGKTTYDTTNKALPLPTMPDCSDGKAPAYIPFGGTCDPSNNIHAPCWKCANGKFHDSNCLTDKTHCANERNLPFMSDDGNGGSISIPSFIVSDYDGEILRQAIKDEEKSGGGVFITMAWEVPQLEEVDYEIWTSSEDHNGAEFKRDFQEVALDLIDNTNFRPRYFIYDGEQQGCMRSGITCSNQCIMNGRYCAPDPDDNFETSISGADIVKENLRQMCIWKVLTDEVVAKEKSSGKTDNTPFIKWWCYANKFANDCYGEDAAMVNSNEFAKCGATVMDKVGIDKTKVQQCIDKSGGVPESCDDGCKNKLLEKEIQDRSNYGIITLPTIVVNGVVLRGESESSGGAAEALAARAICRAFALGYAPEVCDRLLNPIATSNSAGQASISFTATLSSTANELMEYNAEVASRFISTLSLKLGVERASIKIGKPTPSTSCGGPLKCFKLTVTLTNLLCTNEVDETESVAQLLNRVSSCEQNVVSAASASKEVKSLEGKAFYFHTHVTNDGVTHVITARMSNLKKDCKALGGVKGEAYIWIVILCVVLVLALIGVSGFIWYRRVRNDMQMQVQSILAQYQPLDEMNNKGKDESDTSPML
jgi:hypothetical protein